MKNLILTLNFHYLSVAERCHEAVAGALVAEALVPERSRRVEATT